MKSRRRYLDKEAQKLMGMSEVRVYECHDGYAPKDHYYGVWWGGKQRWSVPRPWDANKGVLYQVGLSLRYKLQAEEQLEKVLEQSQLDEQEDAAQSEDLKGELFKECRRTLIDKPLYFYNK